MNNIIKKAHSIAFDIGRAFNGSYLRTIHRLVKNCPTIKEVLLVVRINDNLINCTTSGHWDLLEFDEDEARDYYEGYRGYFIEICDALDSIFTIPKFPPVKLGKLSDPEVRVVGLMRDSVRI
ncbi:hypothetical protein EAF04_002570 [Stromatinia cepivora]|nr:hypothetical protein EAF04_002570 [Stromatinia cepivora]